ncbi:MAG: hypothetical protein ABIQ11_06460 [Saprospiraceae bacterium]
MDKPLLHYRIRRLHRFLGVIIGVQFLMWTVGGLYFSWSDMDEVHGDYDISHPSMISPDVDLISPSRLLDSIYMSSQVDSLMDLKLISIMEIPYWQATWHIRGADHSGRKFFLINALTGKYRPPLTETEATEMAQKKFIGPYQVKSVEYLTETNKHHEYREQPLPAFAITFNNERHTTVYVASDAGVIVKARNQPWRQFDFLWMMHTMDYSSRDNITNWLLRAFSIFGLATVASGFTLFFVSIKKKKKI